MTFITIDPGIQSGENVLLYKLIDYETMAEVVDSLIKTGLEKGINKFGI